MQCTMAVLPDLHELGASNSAAWALPMRGSDVSERSNAHHAASQKARCQA